MTRVNVARHFQDGGANDASGAMRPKKMNVELRVLLDLQGCDERGFAAKIKVRIAFPDADGF